jgi:hypothetical protein
MTPNVRDAVLVHAAKCREATAAGRERPKWEGGSLVRADLSSAYLNGADLRGADLRGADLSGANLRGAKGILSTGPVGEVGRIIYAVAHADEPRFQAGCFWGTETQLRAAIAKKYADGSGLERHRASYLAAVDFLVAALAVTP